MAENDNKQPRIVRHIKPSQPTDVPVKKAVQGQTNAQKLIADKGSDEKALKIIAKDNKHGNIFLIILMILSVFSVTGLVNPIACG